MIIADVGLHDTTQCRRRHAIVAVILPARCDRSLQATGTMAITVIAMRATVGRRSRYSQIFRLRYAPDRHREHLHRASRFICRAPPWRLSPNRSARVFRSSEGSVHSFDPAGRAAWQVVMPLRSAPRISMSAPTDSTEDPAGMCTISNLSRRSNNRLYHRCDDWVTQVATLSIEQVSSDVVPHHNGVALGVGMAEALRIRGEEAQFCLDAFHGRSAGGLHERILLSVPSSHRMMNPHQAHVSAGHCSCLPGKKDVALGIEVAIRRAAVCVIDQLVPLNSCYMLYSSIQLRIL